MSETTETVTQLPLARWKPMDVVFGDVLRRPRMLVLEVSDKYPSMRYTLATEVGGQAYRSESALRTKEEWLTWIDRFADDLTGRELREAKEAVRAELPEPAIWQGFRERFAATGDPFIT